jgi:hypothetical protein
VVNGTLGFGAQVTRLTLVSIKDRGPGVDPLDATDDITYLGVALDDFNGQLLGLDDVLVFHAYGVDALLNKVGAGAAVVGPLATAKLDWSTFAYTGLNIDAELDALNQLIDFGGADEQQLDANVDLVVRGSVALDVLGGVLVARGSFEIALGQVQSAALRDPAQDADVMTLSLSDVQVFVGVGGGLSGITGSETFADVAVVNGTLGFGAQVTRLTLVSIKDRGPGVDPLDATDDITYRCPGHAADAGEHQGPRSGCGPARCHRRHHLPGRGTGGLRW